MQSLQQKVSKFGQDKLSTETTSLKTRFLDLYNLYRLVFLLAYYDRKDVESNLSEMANGRIGG